MRSYDIRIESFIEDLPIRKTRRLFRKSFVIRAIFKIRIRSNRTFAAVQLIREDLIELFIIYFLIPRAFTI